eukprot:CAMPEP_0195518454 /NCGR_PEP_ID=MMETSP0794_2-20130614/12929_1 /TAXON_ID=515487 /ORGANISM="Stephanopyxis turris, Strain CCMP 815" /LENGTH=61 /DNA_ID=CAMNT_0040647417 /DNA_START=262 /DNA_END=447 /DNA_ORIENTATION=-
MRVMAMVVVLLFLLVVMEMKVMAMAVLLLLKEDTKVVMEGGDGRWFMKSWRWNLYAAQNCS